MVLDEEAWPIETWGSYMINKLTNDAIRGTPWSATLDEAYLQASRRGDGESDYVIADNLRKKKVVQHGKKTSSSAETLKGFVYQKTAHLAKDCPYIKKTKNETALAIRKPRAARKLGSASCARSQHIWRRTAQILRRQRMRWR